MRFVSFNVNGLRAILKKDFNKIFDDLNPDIMSLNETKLSDDKFPLEKEGYYIYFTNSKVKKGYSGVSVFSKIKPLNVHYGLEDHLYDDEGRVITLEFETFYYVCCYVPNSGEGLKRLDFRIEYLPNPLSIDFPYGVNDDHKDYYLYFGRLSFEKGVSLLTSVFKELPYKLKIAGEGDIKINNPPSNIEYLGYKSGDELISLVKKAKAIIVPSIWLENAPYSVLEALALGKILIVSNYGGLPELVDDGVNGFIFTNKEELILSINKVENLSKDEYKKMSKASLDKALKITNGKQYVSKLLDLVNRR